MTLPDGSSTLALVPQVYLAPREGDLTADGKLFGGSSTALLAGRNVNLDLEHDLLNSGSIAGRQVVQINAEGISNLGGTITGDRVALQADQDIRNVGGAIGAESSLSLKAGGDIEITSTTMHGEGETQAGRNGSASYSGEYVDRVAALYVSKSDGVLVASAGNDIHLTGAILSSAGDIGLSAGQDINLATLQTGSQSDVYWDKKTMDANKAKPFSGKPAAPPQGAEVISNENGQITYSRNYAHMGQSAEVGSQLSAGGNIVLNAGQDIHSRAGSVQTEGALLASAGQDITLEAGQSSYNVTAASYASDSGPMVSGSSTLKTSYGGTNAQGSDWGGAVVSLEATRDLTVAGSNVVGDQGTRLEAGEDLRILAVETQSHQSRFEKDTQSGLSTGGMGVSLGTSSQSADQRGTQTHAAGSTVGSIQGDVTVVAGKGYQQVGSDVMAPKGDITIQAESIQIVEARETSHNETEQRFSQSGLSLGLSNPLLSAMQGMDSTAQAMQNTESERMQALGAATLAMQAQQTVAGVQKTVADGGNPASVGISVSIGSSSSKSTTESDSNTAKGSLVKAGGDVTIVASGAGRDSDIEIQGSDISAKGKVSLGAEGDIILLAARNNREQHSDQSSKNGSLGVSFGGGSQNGVAINASASRSQGSGDGAETFYTNTHVNAGEGLLISSGGDTSLIGAVATANQIRADIGGDFIIQSLQDQATYDEKSKSAGFSVSLCIPPICTGTSSVSVSYGQTKIDSNYQSVTEQSGLRAGDGGFQVNVKGDTDLIGGAITSADKAVDGDKNTFQAASLTLRDLENKASYSAESVGMTVGSGGSSRAGYGSDSGNDSSVTRSGISGVAGNQAARTGDKETGIANKFDAEKVRQEIESQLRITAEFGHQAHTAVADYSKNKRTELKELLKNASTEQDRQTIQAQIDEINMQERVLNVLIGAVTGFGGAAALRESLDAAADKMRELMIEESKKFPGVVDKDGKLLVSNDSGKSAGLDGDGKKLAGTRIDLEKLCADNLCENNADGTRTFKGSKEEFEKRLKEFSGPTGGVQGSKGTLFGFEYSPGGFVDHLMESFAGSHDFLFGSRSGLYDDQGNANQARLDGTKTIHEGWSAIGVLGSSPFAAAQGLPPDVWNGIAMFLRAGK
ncbi:hemagglutinin repeat-containing protein [Leptospira sp. 96542]|nr:hemagglutinin repeat-containing protein [Leptospira sp. 96542]